MESKRSSHCNPLPTALDEIEDLRITRRELLDRVAELERAFKQELISHEEDLQEAKEDIDNLTRENRILRDQLHSERSTLRQAHFIEQDAESLADKHRDLLKAHKIELERQASYEILISQLQTELQHKEEALEQRAKYISAIEKAKKHLSDKYLRKAYIGVKKELAAVKGDLVKKADGFIGWRDDILRREQAAKGSQDEYRRLLKQNGQLNADLKEALKKAASADAAAQLKNERMKTLRTLNTKLEAKAKEADACVGNLMGEIRQIQEAMERMNSAKSTSEATEISKLKDQLAMDEAKAIQLMSKVAPLLHKTSQQAQSIEM